MKSAFASFLSEHRKSYTESRQSGNNKSQLNAEYFQVMFFSHFRRPSSRERGTSTRPTVKDTKWETN